MSAPGGRRRLTMLLSAVAAAVLLAACSSTKTPGAASGSTTTKVPTSHTPTSNTATTSTTAPVLVPTLGQPAGVFSQGSVGFGQVRPSEVFNGGDPTGMVSTITWNSWGGSQATGVGQSDYVGPNQSVAQGTQESVTIVAFDLGTCSGKYMYQAVEWYFPQHGQSFDPSVYEDICTGSYVGSS